MAEAKLLPPEPAQGWSTAPVSGFAMLRVLIGSRLRSQARYRASLGTDLVTQAVMVITEFAELYVMLGAMGVWSKLNSNVGDLLTNNSAAELVSGSSIFGAAALIGLVDVVVLTAMATLGVVIYNLSTDVVGGVEVTLADLD